MSRISATHVVGHVNPDTDSVAAAVGYAWLLAEQQGRAITPARAGGLNRQTSWALERLGLEPPRLLVDAAPRFAAVARRLETVEPSRALSEAWGVASRSGTCPLVHGDGRPAGLITGLSLFAHLVRQVGQDPQRQQLTLAEFLQSPCLEAADPEVPLFRAEARIRDRLKQVLREEHDDFWVVDEQGRYVGICRKPDLLDPPRLELILVDHNEARQSVGALEEAVVLEVLDHHRLDTSPTRLPIRFHVDPVGSTSTLVSERTAQADVSPPPALAGLLLAGLLSDTLLLRSPTTTERDRRAAKRLGGWALVPGSPLEGESVESFGRQLLAAGSGLATRAPAEVVSTDLKLYSAGDRRFGVAQVEVTDMHEVSENLERLNGALGALREQRGLDLCLLMVTDIIGGSSRLLCSGEEVPLDGLPYPRLPDGTLDARGVVSRKKQLLPALLTELEG